MRPISTVGCALALAVGCIPPCHALDVPDEIRGPDHSVPGALDLSPVAIDLAALSLPGSLRQSMRVTWADPETNLVRSTVRLDTTFERADAERAGTWRAGDFVSSPYAPWAAPVRLGGVQWQGRAGRVDYSLGTGYLRRAYAVESYSYGSHPAALASLRAGLTDWLSVSGHTESAPELADGGLGLTAHLGEFGQLSGSAALSSEPGWEGSHWTQAWQMSHAGVGVRAARTGSSGRYRTLAGESPAQLGTELSMAGAFRGANLTLGYTHVQAPAGSFASLTLAVSRPFGKRS